MDEQVQRMLHIDLIAAARPNFMKVAPLHAALSRESAWCKVRLIHTGQHYDTNMSGAFLADLGLPDPDINLGVGSGSHAEQTAGVMVAYEKFCLQSRPDWVVVVGDVNSTLACTLAATKLGIRVAHLEAGLRSRDRSMPEELNRIATDALADLLWTPSVDADDNLLKEGVAAERICRVGNIMMDALEMSRKRIDASDLLQRLGLTPGHFGVVTLHRPSNVDDDDQLHALVDMLAQCAPQLDLVFPIHPRTQKRLAETGLDAPLKNVKGLHVIAPLGYVDFMALVFGCAVAITDSGGIQEETTYLGIPCITLRETTERPITITLGTNRLMKPLQVPHALGEIRTGKWPKGQRPELWDGQTARRIVENIKGFHSARTPRSSV